MNPNDYSVARNNHPGYGGLVGTTGTSPPLAPPRPQVAAALEVLLNTLVSMDVRLGGVAGILQASIPENIGGTSSSSAPPASIPTLIEMCQAYANKAVDKSDRIAQALGVPS